MLLFPATICAQEFKVVAYAVENLTNAPVKKATGVILNSKGDTVSVAQRSMAYVGRGNDMQLRVTLSFAVPRTAGEYTIEASAPDYETVYRSVSIDRVGRREQEMRIADLVFCKPSRKLDEVTVTASKVKFYNKGDTLIYNADAFQLAEGSMLDVLVRQLPGVEIKDGGQIYVNGKFVESLILNGKDFFQGNNNLMLNNLGAYTVKDIAVYDKWSDRSLLAGRDLGDSQYVMDVRLKRDYMSGYIGNIGLGGGTSDKYLARLFGMWYTTVSRVTLIANFNNLNDSRTPGQNDSWKATMNPGDTQTKMGGLDYNINSTDKKWEFKGNTTASHVRDNVVTNINRQNFIPSGDTYDRQYARVLTHDLNLSTRNSLIFRTNNKYFSIGQNLVYRNNDINSRSLSGTFDRDDREMTQQILEKIYSGEPTSLTDHTINTVQTRLKKDGTSLEAGGSLYGSLHLPHTPDLISMSVVGSYGSDTYRQFNLYDIKYPRLATHTTDYQYQRNSPDHRWNIHVSPSYEYLYSAEGSIDFQPSYYHSTAVKDSYLYDLDRLEDTGIFGVLPSDYLSTLNNDQTYFSTERTDILSLIINAKWRKEIDDDHTLSCQIFPSLKRQWRELDYRQGNYDSPVTHNSVDLELTNTNISYIAGKNSYKLMYERSVQSVPLSRLVTVTDSRDPLNIYIGNENIKNAASNTLSAEWSHSVHSRHRWSNILQLYYTLWQNKLVNAYTFNPATGVRTFSMHNVSGNYDWKINNNLVKSFGPKDQFDIYSYTTLYYGRTIDYAGLTEEALTESKIHNLSIAQTLQLGWRVGKHTVALKGQVIWRNTDGDNSGFNSFSSTTAQYGATASMVLPLNFGLSTDLTLYSRRGYADKKLNTTDVVWNARLSYTLKGGRWVLMMDGFDLLHQLNNVIYNVNEQGRTETWTNVLPRYALLHVQYRFAIQPKKK